MVAFGVFVPAIRACNKASPAIFVFSQAVQPDAHPPAGRRGVVRRRRDVRSVDHRHPVAVANSAVLLMLLSVVIFLLGLVSERISSLRFEGRRP
jgi:hypothetical protein